MTRGDDLRQKGPLRVLIVDHVSKVLGGAEVNLIELLSHPARVSHWSVQVACAPKSPVHDRLRESGISCAEYGLDRDLNELRVVGRKTQLLQFFRGWRRLQFATHQLLTIAQAFQPHVLLSCTNKDHFVAGRVAARLSLPSAWWINDILSTDFFPSLVCRAFAWQARRRASRLFPVSNAAAEALRTLGIPDSKIFPIPNGIPLSRYRYDATRPLRAQLGLSPDTPLIGTVGRVTPWKGQKFFVELARQWIQQGRPGHFVIVGRAFNEDQPYEQEIRDLLQHEPLASRVHWIPFQSDIAGALSSLDLFVHCALKPEPFGRVLIEAMAVGVPVLGARSGGATEILADPACGWLATPGDAGSYLDGMKRALELSRESRETVVAAARSRVQQQYSLDRVWNDFATQLDRLAETRKTSAP